MSVLEPIAEERGAAAHALQHMMEEDGVRIPGVRAPEEEPRGAVEEKAPHRKAM